MINSNNNTLLKKKLFLCLIITLLIIKQIINIMYSHTDIYLYIIVQIILILINRTSIRLYLSLITLETICIFLFKNNLITNNIYYTLSYILTLLGIFQFLKPNNINQYLHQPIHLYLNHISITTIILLTTHFLLNIYVQSLKHLNYLLEFVQLIIQSYILLYSILTLINYLKHNIAKKLSISFLKEHKYSESTLVILDYFENNKTRFLSVDFTINTLSTEVKIPVHEISKKINNELNTNYYTMIAFYRIQHAKQLIQLEPNYKIEAIAEECGFNSRGTFTKYFKLFVKCTPTEYKNTII
ncbi:helix-turn-helix domain-containing protein [Myroides sp. C4067]|uniref:helix-turn-helix domain-containing protein n=1 Tax=Myroides sp. C4067 TaxID=3136765 RepID=UPI00310157F2